MCVTQFFFLKSVCCSVVMSIHRHRHTNTPVWDLGDVGIMFGASVGYNHNFLQVGKTCERKGHIFVSTYFYDPLTKKQKLSHLT